MTLVETGDELHRPSMLGDAASSSDQQKQHHLTAGATRQQRRGCAWDDDDDDAGKCGAGAAPIEEPPCVWSPFSSSSTRNQDCGSLRRKLVHQTPQHVATLIVPSSSSSSSSKTTTNESFALVPPLLYQEEYVIQALSSSSSSGGGGKIAFWMLANKQILGQRGKNSTFRRTLHPDFVLDTGANAPLVDLALFFDDDEQDAAGSDTKNSIGDKQQQQYPSILALSTLGEVFCISIQNSQQQRQRQRQQSSSCSPTTTTSNNMETNKPYSSSSSSTNPPTSSLCITAEVLLAWNTGRAGATCLTTAPCSSSLLSHESNTRQRRIQRQILIGYQSGHLEAWKILCVNNNNNNVMDNAAAFTCDDHIIMQAEKMWTGVFDHHFPIHSLLHVPGGRPAEHNNRVPPAMPNNSTTTTTPTNNGNDDHNREAAQRSINGSCSSSNEYSYLALALHPPTRLSTPSYMEIINLAAVEQQATHLKAAREKRAADKEVLVSSMVVSLENHWVLPLPGKEIRDPSAQLRGGGGGGAASAANGDLRSRSRGKRANNTASSPAANSKPGTVHWIPSNSTNRLCSLVGSSTGYNGGRPSFAVALADGTIGLLSATKVEAMHEAQLSSSSSSGNDIDENKSNNGNGSHSRLDWGISTPMDQLLLSYPCIGLGKVDLLSIPHAVCALRGGTVYLIPLVGTVENNNDDDDMNSAPPPPPPLTVITYPDDIDTDTAMQHLQAFAAGMVVLDKDSSNARLPLLFFSWPGGVIDVYSCHLLRSDAQVDRFALAELLANGSVESLKSLLSCLGDEHGGDNRADLLQAMGPSGCTSMARREIECLNGKVLTLNDLSSEKLKTFRSILFRFAGRE